MLDSAYAELQTLNINISIQKLVCTASFVKKLRKTPAFAQLSNRILAMFSRPKNHSIVFVASKINQRHVHTS